MSRIRCIVDHILSWGSLITPGRYRNYDVLSDYLIHNNKHILEMIYKGMANRCGLRKVQDGTGEEIIATSEDTTAGDRDWQGYGLPGRVPGIPSPGRGQGMFSQPSQYPYPKHGYSGYLW
jgi:hypothetical protein